MVKNVTGYDLCKLLAGSWGTLAAMTEVTVKTLPRAETEETLLLLARDDAAAAQAMTAAMGSFADVSGAAYLPAGPASRVGELSALGGGVAALRLEGVGPSVAHRKELLAKLLAGFGNLESLSATASRALWRAIRDVAPFAAGGPFGERYVWRISTAPARGVDVGRKLREAAQAESFYDWAGGLVWAALPPTDDAGVALCARGCRSHRRPRDAYSRAGRGAGQTRRV